MTETLLSSKKASSYLKVSQATINKWADTGIINSFKTPGGHRRFQNLLQQFIKLKFRIAL